MNKSIALVIGAGGVKCAAAIGLWQLLQEEEIPVSLAVGSSGGSMYAACIALGYDAVTIQEMTLSFWTNDLMTGYASNLKAALSGNVRFTERSGLVDDAAALSRLQDSFGETTFADAKTALRIVSTDFLSGERVIHQDGRLLDAIRASIAVPTIFPPGKWTAVC